MIEIIEPFRLEVVINQKKKTFESSGTKLGSGAFSIVCLGVDIDTSQKVAIKILKSEWENKANNSPQLKEQLLREIKIMEKICHRNVISLIATCKHPLTNTTCLILEYCSLGNLETMIQKGPIPEEDAKMYLGQIALGLQELHKWVIIHRDLKPENILLTRDEVSKDVVVKIADFGLARPLEQGLAQTYCGTPPYMAPEIRLSQNYTTKVDIWALGIIFHRMLTKHPSMNEIFCGTQFDPDKEPDLSSFSRDCKNLLFKMLQIKPEARITSDELVLHPFLKRKDLKLNISKTKRKYTKQQIDEFIKGLIEVEKLAERMASISKTNEAFAIYVKLILELKIIQDSQSTNDQNISQHYNKLKNKALKLKETIIQSETVDNPFIMLIEYVIEKGKEGAQAEIRKSWNTAMENYLSAIYVLKLLDNHMLRNGGTIVEQAVIINYIEKFVERIDYVQAYLSLDM